VAETIPLSSGLGVEVVDVVVSVVLADNLNLMFERLSVECWCFWEVEWEAIGVST
jgi:hypothetical protein